jgi:hypothetical protein
MDFVAYEMMRRYLSQADVPPGLDDPSLAPVPTLRVPPRGYQDDGQSLHLARASPVGAKDGGRRDQGREAAEKLLNLLGHNRPSPDGEAWKDFLRISLELNLHNGFVDERETLVEVVLTHVHKPVKDPPEPLQQHVSAAFSNFLNDMDLNTRVRLLFKALAQIADST